MAPLAFPAVPGASAAALLTIRAVAGTVLAYHGYLKVDGGPGNFADNITNFAVFGVGLPRFLGYVVVVLELVGGLCLILGLLVRLWSLLLTVQFVAIPFVVKSEVGLINTTGAGPTGFEIDLLIAACAFTLLLLGPGPLSLDRAAGLEPARPAA